jgi:basic membrane lipoprotein Med (substrate-binding protein (PBP1-ABC) superfamily)
MKGNTQVVIGVSTAVSLDVGTDTNIPVSTMKRPDFIIFSGSKQ